MQSLVVSREKQLEVRSNVEYDGCYRGIRVEFHIHLWEDVLHSAEVIEHTPE